MSRPAWVEYEDLRYRMPKLLLSDPSQRESHRTAGKRRKVSSLMELQAYWDGTVVEFARCRHGQLDSVEAARPYVEYALEHGAVAMLMSLARDHGFDVHEFRWADGRSALHYLIDADRAKYLRNGWSIDWILQDGVANHSDRHGFTYFHAACATGKRDLAKRLIDESVEVVDVDSWKTSPLHLACQYRHEAVVKLLLDWGADPNQRLDRQGGAPLHALARLCLCECASHENFCDRRKPADRIVELLLEEGADLESVDCHGDTPLQAAVASCDADLARCLLDRGASLAALNEDRLFGREFGPLELKNYPLTLNILETVELLQSRGYEMSLKARMRMIKCWVKIRGLDVDHLIPELEKTRNILAYDRYMQNLFVHIVHTFYLKQESMDYLREKRWELRQAVEEYDANRIDGEHDEQFVADMAFEAGQLRSIEVKRGLSLYDLCQMDHHKGSIEMKDRWSDWRCPELHELDYTRLIVKRYLANCRIRPHLESCAADIVRNFLQRFNIYGSYFRFDASVSSKLLLGWCTELDENKLFVPETPRRPERWKVWQIGWDDGKKRCNVRVVMSSKNR